MGVEEYVGASVGVVSWPLTWYSLLYSSTPLLFPTKRERERERELREVHRGFGSLWEAQVGRDGDTMAKSGHERGGSET